jgi:CRISPR-associated endonuclease Csn1
VAIFRHPDGRVETQIVSLFEAADRLRRRQKVISKHLNGASFVMSLAQGDTLSFPDGMLKGLWIVQGVWSAGPIVLWRAEDATGATVFRPTAASILSAGGRKVAVDPIGRMHPARD